MIPLELRTRAWLKKAWLDLEAGTFEPAHPALLGDVTFHAQQASSGSRASGTTTLILWAAAVRIGGSMWNRPPTCRPARAIVLGPTEAPG